MSQYHYVRTADQVLFFLDDLPEPIITLRREQAWMIVKAFDIMSQLDGERADDFIRGVMAGMLACEATPRRAEWHELVGRN